MVLSENHQLMRKLFRQFAETEFTPALLDRLDETGEFDWDIHHKMSAAGFMGAKIPYSTAARAVTRSPMCCSSKSSHASAPFCLSMQTPPTPWAAAPCSHPPTKSSL